MKCLLCRCIKPEKVISVREMYFGTGERFHYFECSACSSLTLMNDIKDFKKYYPEEYYSYSKPFSKSNNALKSSVHKIRTLYVLEKKYKLIGRIIIKLFKIPRYLQYLKDNDAKINNNMLDVGSGNGSYLSFLKSMGFCGQLIGQDPFIEDEIHYDSNFYITNKDITQINKTFDIITFWHSLEHIANPDEVLTEINRILSEKGKILIALPTSSGEAYKIYKENWFAIDAPRHIFLPTIRD